MSITGRRKKKMVFVWLFGFLTATLISILVLILLRFDVIVLAKDTFESIGTPKEASVTITVASRPIEAGTIITEEDLSTIEIPESKAINNPLSSEILLGQRIIIGVQPMMPITNEMIRGSDAINQKERIYEFDYISIPTLMNEGDIVDVRIVFPNGQDYTILSKKEIVGLMRTESEPYSGIVGLMVNEDEMLRMSSALVDKILTVSANIYMVKYVDPLIQEKALISYPVNRSVISVLEKNPNLVTMPNMSLLTENRALLDKAMKELLDDDDEWYSLFGEDEDEELLSQDSMEKGQPVWDEKENLNTSAEGASEVVQSMDTKNEDEVEEGEKENYSMDGTPKKNGF